MNSSPRFLKLGVALVAVAGLLLAAFSVFGHNLRRAFGTSADSLMGDTDVANSRSASSRTKKLVNFGQDTEEGDSAPSASTAVAAAPMPSGNVHEGMRPNPFTLTRDKRLSTFAVDVDTASYTLFRRYVTEGGLPPPASIRVEEWVNYFKYRSPEPEQGDFRVDLEGAPSPFTPGRHLLQVGLQARNLSKSERKPTHLVFLVDTSGSMNSEDKLPLAQKSMKLMVDGLNEQDTVALVTYAGSVRDVLPPTPASQHDTLFAAIDSLSAGGGTAMGSGLELAYRHAVRTASSKSISRVIVLTDGDTNLGPHRSAQEMLESVRGYVQEGVTLSTIGFGMGNYHDALMEQLADKGNGNCSYIDSEREARRVFQERLAGTLEVVAQDVKVQVEFDPDSVRGYRLLGYENRALADKDFRDDKVDAGELGAGHSVTALYEVELQGEAAPVATVRVRAKKPGGSEASEQRFTLSRPELHSRLSEASSHLRFAAAVAGTADILRGAPQAGSWSLATAESLAEGSLDGLGERIEFLHLLRDVRVRHAATVARATPY